MLFPKCEFFYLFHQTGGFLRVRTLKTLSLTHSSVPEIQSALSQNEVNDRTIQPTVHSDQRQNYSHSHRHSKMSVLIVPGMD